MDSNMINTGYTAGTKYENIPNTSAGVSGKTDGCFADMMSEKYHIFPKDMTLTEYKLYFQDKINSLYTHPSQKRLNWFIDITDAAYRRMQNDPAYEQRVLNFLAKAKSTNYGSHVPRFALIHIDDTWEKCYGYTFGTQDDERARRAAQKRRMEAERAKKARRKKLLKEYLQKKAQAKRLQDKLLNQRITNQKLEHVRLLKSWNEDRQRIQASRAYEANLFMLYRRELQIASRPQDYL
ncbi:MAG: hypothetical protein HFH84_17685 [Lachnospiraceae bacterium]|jgi:hypothetical protein|nr:hypothetical protein [Lachnospiraceae bacterium]